MAKRANKKNPLDDYRGKRDPGTTNEPFGETRRTRKAQTRDGAFVVHLHAASRRHHDLRIEISGTLKSFAVPRGPSLDPKEKRLAVQTEDHPIEYLDFEGVIPEGNYGAGSMIAWDRGRVRYLETSAEEGVEKGKIDFELRGSKLRGRFALVRTSGRKEPLKANEKPQWLLIKKKDAHAKAGEENGLDERSILSGLTVEELARPQPIVKALTTAAKKAGAPQGDLHARKVHPMLCALEDAALKRKGWLFELKLDGVRILASKHGADVGLAYRSGRVATLSFPEITRAIRALPVEHAVVDGEIVAFDNRGRPDFERLGPRFRATRPSDVMLAEQQIPVTYVVFDLLSVEGFDLSDVPLRKRKEMLAALVRGKGLVRTLDYLEDDGTLLFQFCEEHDLEGVIAKRADSRYRQGPSRTGDWIKIKRARTGDFVIVGWTAGEGSRKELGALELASFDQGELVYRGAVGSGLSPKTIDTLVSALRTRAADHLELRDPPDPSKRRHFVRPEIVARVRYSEWTEAGHLRHPVFIDLVASADPKLCTACPPHSENEVGKSSVEAPRRETRTVGRHRVQLTNQTKVFWPEEGITKGDVCDYYDTIAPAILPFLKDRPVVLVRYPDGITGKSFYQWSVPKDTPSWIRTFQLRSEEDEKGEKTAFLVDDVDTLLYIANMGCIPLHVLGFTAEHPDDCDFLTIDLDISGGTFEDVVTLARSLHELLNEIGLPGFPKTSGHTGIHVCIPVAEGVSFDDAKRLVEVLGHLLARRHPDIATLERRKEHRGARVLVDTGQTAPSRTIVAPYSVRAHPGATVSTPLAWEEVGFHLDPTRHALFTVPSRVETRPDPWRGFFDQHPDIGGTMEKIERLLRKPRGKRADGF